MLIGLCPDKGLSGKRARLGNGIRQGVPFGLRLREGAFIFILVCEKTRKEKTTMKTKLLSFILVIVLLLSFTSCATGEKNTVTEEPATQAQSQTATEEATEDGDQIAAEGLWKDALYRKDMTFGEGEKKIEVEVKAEDKSVTFTLNTDKEDLASALLEHKLVEGEDSTYGLYIKKVNGITADYDVDQSYWSFCKDGEAQMTGVSDAKLAGGEHFELVYTK